MIVYIAGPMTGYPDFNRAAFHLADALLTERGHIVLNPAHHPDGLTLDEYMHMDLPMIDICDIVYLLKGWELSKGANIEKAYAEKYGKTVMG